MTEEYGRRMPPAVLDAVVMYGFNSVVYAAAAVGDYRVYYWLIRFNTSRRSRELHMKRIRTEYASEHAGTGYFDRYYSGTDRCVRSPLFL